MIIVHDEVDGQITLAEYDEGGTLCAAYHLSTDEANKVGWALIESARRREAEGDVVLPVEDSADEEIDEKRSYFDCVMATCGHIFAGTGDADGFLKLVEHFGILTTAKKAGHVVPFKTV